MKFNQFKQEFQKSPVFHSKNKVPANVLVSVIVQTFNHEKYIEQCLDSILIQNTDFEFEILIGEDNSYDYTGDICIDYATRFPEKIRLFLHKSENNISILNAPTGNFNAFYNLFSSNGKYIAFCEGDDVWNDPLKLQKQVNFLESNKSYSFTYHSYKTINSENSVVSSDEEKNQPKTDINSYDLKTCKFHPLLLTVCFRNQFQEIPIEMINVINVDSFLISLLGNIGEAKFLKSIEASLYRKHDGGIWSHRIKEKKNRSKILTYKNLSQYYKIKEGIIISDYFKNLVENSYKSLIHLQLKKLSFLKAFSTISDYLKFYFRSIKINF